jgi:photosystem II stability/assembly factor-like uncharacterized protein
MRIVFALIFCFFLSYSHAQWTWSYPEPQGNNLYSSIALDTHTILLCGESASLLKLDATKDAIRFVNTSYNNRINSVFFTDSINGYLAGDNGFIAKSNDGGQSWNKISSFSSTSFNTIFFSTLNQGFAAGRDGKIYKTTDRGVNWIPVYSSTKPIESIYFIDSLKGFACGWDGLLVYTTNGGNTWNSKNINTTKGLLSITFTSQNVGYIGAAIGSVYKTIDGGNTWFHRSSGTGEDINDIEFINSNEGFIAGNNGTIAHSTNGGFSWTIIPANTKRSFYTLSILDSLIYVAGEGGYIGKLQLPDTSVHQLWGSTIQDLSRICFIDSLHGYSLGDKRLLKTSNAGTSWNIIDLKQYNMEDIHFFSRDTGIAVGDSGFIYETANGGLDWTRQSSSYEKEIKSIFFLNRNLGYAAGFGFVLKSIDGGKTWDKILLPSGFPVNSVYFINPQKGFICGQNGKVVRTSNGGANWTNINPVVPNYHYFDIHFIDDKKGFIVGEAGTVLITYDGGGYWTTKTLNTQSDLYCVGFTDALKGFIAGTNGDVFKTTDAGFNWKNIGSITKNRLQAMHILNDSTFFVCGEYATILKYTSPPDVSVYEGSVENSMLKIYPNPVIDDWLTIYLEATDIGLVQITDLQGQEVLSFSGQDIQNHLLRCPVSHLKAGSYFIRATGSNRLYYSKFIKL